MSSKPDDKSEDGCITSILVHLLMIFAVLLFIGSFYLEAMFGIWPGLVVLAIYFSYKIFNS